MRKAVLTLFCFLLAWLPCKGQIVNRLKVDAPVFERYASGRMQMFNPDNLVLADSLYKAGEARGTVRYKCLGLSLEFPVRFAQGDYDRMDEAVAEIKKLLMPHPDTHPFMFSTVHEYCQYLIQTGRASDAMLEARAMERLATREKNALGLMYSHRIVGIIQSYRTNAYLAIQHFNEAAGYCREAKAEQELPVLYLLISQEYIKLGKYDRAEEYCTLAEGYQDFFPSLKILTRMTRAHLFYTDGDMDSFWRTYDSLVNDPLYKVQAESDSRYGIDVCYLQSKGLFDAALAKADSLSTARERHSFKHGIYAAKGSYPEAYEQIGLLMSEKDSIYIKVQNEDLAILDAEMNNARLRQEAQRLKAQNEMSIMLGFLAMFAIAFFGILFSQWQLRQNLDQMQKKNNEMLAARRAYQMAMDAKESENATRIKILQNRKSNTIKL